MKHRTNALAVATAVLSLPLLAFAQPSKTPNQSSQNSQTGSAWNQSSQQMHQHSARWEAQQMVPVEATLIKRIDARDMHPGWIFTAKVNKDVTLSNGIRLDHSAKLVGKIVKDNMNSQNGSRLALRIMRIDMPDGKVVPVKATIVGVITNNYASTAYPNTEVPNTWNDHTLQVDQENVLHGVDLHSRIGSRNSGVFVSRKDKNVTLNAGTELQLAVAPRSVQKRNSMMKNGA